MFSYRYAVLKDRILRNEKFSNLPENSHSFILRTTTHLKGCSESDSQCIFGLLSQLKEGIYFLEDPEGSVQLDLSDANCSTGIYTENSFVILEGFVKPDGTFKVSSLCLPPGEPAEQTKKYYGHIDFLSNESDFVEDTSLLQAMEEQLSETEIIFIMDFHLDDAQIESKFFTLLDLIETKRLVNPTSVPAVIVLAGSFMHNLPSKYAPQLIQIYQDNFDEFFAKLSKKYSEICKRATFVFVPSSDDPFSTLLLPKETIPISTEKHPSLNIVFTSNPARIRYFTREIVFFRDDLMSRIQRNCIVLPNEGKFEEHVSFYSFHLYF